MPPILYGTAWKEERTAPLVGEALEAGFCGIDTANQRKHYHEAGVGAALQAAIDGGHVRREQLFLQSKFTHIAGQDGRLPYDPGAPVREQVRQSFASSLEHLGTAWLDAYLLHGPSTRQGLADQDLDAWRGMEDLHERRVVRFLGVSNVDAGQLEELHTAARVKPSIVQNRTFTRPQADADVRAFCAAHGIAYQGFSLLTAIPHVLASPELRRIAHEHGLTPAQTVFAYCMQRDIIVLTGTTSRVHMEEDLRVVGQALPGASLAQIDGLVTAR